MPMITGSVFLAGALLSCILPITLLICFVTFFGRTVRRMPPNATPNGQQVHHEPSAPAAPAPERQFPNLPE
ncbi:MAG TPA: hypothetical protein VHU61_17635 [Solirubrobacteraceae bacterium]|nr:hypothetical protein [Solirubrobacteraceae bacterium]